MPTGPASIVPFLTGRADEAGQELAYHQKAGPGYWRCGWIGLDWHHLGTVSKSLSQ
jgi:hypothetical protein